MSPAPVSVRIPGSHHPGTRLRLVPGFRDPGSVPILGQVTEYGNPYSICNNDVIMSAKASQIPGIPTVSLTISSGANKQNQRSVSLAFVRENPSVTDGFPPQRASNAEKVSIWWHHYDISHDICTHFVVRCIIYDVTHNTPFSIAHGISCLMLNHLNMTNQLVLIYYKYEIGRQISDAGRGEPCLVENYSMLVAISPMPC